MGDGEPYVREQEGAAFSIDCRAVDVAEWVNGGVRPIVDEKLKAAVTKNSGPPAHSAGEPVSLSAMVADRAKFYAVRMKPRRVLLRPKANSSYHFFSRAIRSSGRGVAGTMGVG